METTNFIEPRKGIDANFTKPYIPNPRIGKGASSLFNNFINQDINLVSL